MLSQIFGWLRRGNAGTNPATDFIGTTDNNDFVVKSNNAEVARFKSDGQVQISPSAAQQLTVLGNMEVGQSSGDHRRIRLGGGNSSAFLYGAFATLGDGVHFGYNYYSDNVSNIIPVSSGPTSRITVGYGLIDLAIGGPGVAPSSVVRVSSGGNVGVGTTTPTENLTVYSPSTTDPATFGVFNNYSGPNLSGSDYQTGVVKLGVIGFHASISSKIPNNRWSDAARLDISTPMAPNNGTQRIRVSVMPFNGFVGIGTTEPTSKLQVVGLPVYANNAAAITAGLTAGAFYHAGDGIVRVVF